MLQDFLRLFNAISTEEDLAYLPNVSRLQRCAAHILSTARYLPRPGSKPKDRLLSKQVLFSNFPSAESDSFAKISQSSTSSARTSVGLTNENSTRILHGLLFEGREMRKREKYFGTFPILSESFEFAAKKWSSEHVYVNPVMIHCPSISHSQSSRLDAFKGQRSKSVSVSKDASGMVMTEHRRLSGDNAAAAKTFHQVNQFLHTRPFYFEREPVQLPNKIARIIQPKITSHLRWSAEYVYKFVDNRSRWFNVYKYTWFRLLIVSMAEHGVNFVYTGSKDAFESLSAGDAVLPWIGISRDPRKILPTRSDAEDILKCIKWLQELQLTPKDYKELRELILLSGPDANDFASYTYKYFHTRFCLSRPKFEGSIVETVRLNNTIVKLSEMKAEVTAGLLCSHLRGHSSRNAILSEEMRASIDDTESHSADPSSHDFFTSSSVQEQLVNSFLKMLAKMNSQSGN